MWQLTEQNNALVVTNKDKQFGLLTVVTDKKSIKYEGRDIERFPKKVQTDINEWMERKCKEHEFAGIWDIEAFMEW
jgi:hypothetical protein